MLMAFRKLSTIDVSMKEATYSGYATLILLILIWAYTPIKDTNDDIIMNANFLMLCLYSQGYSVLLYSMLFIL